MHIVNGRFVDECYGNFTCIANGGHSVVDSHIVSSELFKCIAHFNVQNFDDSDYFPLYAQLKFQTTEKLQKEQVELSDTIRYDRYIWRKYGHETFIENFTRNFASL